MRVTKPSWVVHEDEKKKKGSIYSLSVHPDSSRLATGGLDTKVKIWSTLPILSEDAASNDANPKLLCTLTLHNGPVLTVRWAHHGRYLASGSDDGVVMVWDLDPSGGGKVWGSDDVNVENWKPLKRLIGHESDVVDLAWNLEDSLIASVGLDSTIFIWDGYTFERLKKIEEHQGFVKGVCWDPVGEFLATQSDDKTVKIWNTSNWSLAASVEKPFQSSPANTFYRRLSWSPDGSFIAASNAMNGPVFVAAVIERHDWGSDISFVGHENTIQVAAFNPRIFFPQGQTAKTNNASSMVALGADDNSISIWRNTSVCPVVVLKEIFERQILDLCWSGDGLSVYGCSSDGTVCAINFDPVELPDLSTLETTLSVLKDSIGYKERRTYTGDGGVSVRSGVASFAPAPAGTGPKRAELVNILPTRQGPQKVTRLPNGKRRIQPALIATLSSTEVMNPPSFAPQAPIPSRVAEDAADAFAEAAEQPLESQSAANRAREALLQDVDMAFDDGPPSFAAESSTPMGQKRKAHDESPPATGRQIKARTLGGDRARVAGPVKEIRPTMIMPTLGTGGGNDGLRLPIAVVQTKVRVKAEDDENVVLEADNDEAGGPTTVTQLKKGDVMWLDFAEKPVISMAASAKWSAVTFEDSTLLVYSANGVRRMAPIKLDAPVSHLHVCRNYVMTVTASGVVRAWDMLTRKSLFSPLSVVPLLAEVPSSSTKPVTILDATIRPNGVPFIQLSSGTAYAYDTSLESWQQLCSSWWAESSPIWTRTRSINARGPVDTLEASMNELRPELSDAAESAAGKSRPKYWEEALSLGHLETRLQACVLLDSPTEYKKYLTVYAKKLSDEGFRDKAEELIKELYGPIYHKLGGDQTWQPTVCGFQKRELLRDILSMFAKSRSLAVLGQTWQDTVKSASNE